MKTYVAIVRDHSGSMRGLEKGAINDFNLMIDGIRDSNSTDQENFITVVECGVGPTGKVVTQERNVPVNQVRHLTSYHTTGGSTPLLDSVGEAISQLVLNSNWNAFNIASRATDAYLVLVITDGYENASSLWTKVKLAQKIRELKNSDKWTFVFRGPVGSKQVFQNLGVEPGNIMEWEQTDVGIAKSTQATSSGISNYFSGRSRGLTSTQTFYTDLSKVSVETVKRNLKEVTNEYSKYVVPQWDNGIQIQDFIAKQGISYEKGRALYQLTKPEREVQDHKVIAIRDKHTGKIYAGADARHMLGLPTSGAFKLAPGNHGQYDIFIQSTSVNRKLVGGTSVLYK